MFTTGTLGDLSSSKIWNKKGKEEGEPAPLPPPFPTPSSNQDPHPGSAREKLQSLKSTEGPFPARPQAKTKLPEAAAQEEAGS